MSRISRHVQKVGAKGVVPIQPVGKIVVRLAERVIRNLLWEDGLTIPKRAEIVDHNRDVVTLVNVLVNAQIERRAVAVDG